MAAVSHLFKVVTRWQAKSGIARDAAQFDLYFRFATNPDGTDMTNLMDGVHDWWHSTGTTSTVALENYLSNELSNSASAIDIDTYSVPTVRGVLGPPFSHATYGTPTLGTSGLPEEVALCMSYSADLSSVAERGAGGTRPRARRRGRVFIGPLSQAAAQQDTTTKRTKPATVALSAWTDNAKQFLATALLADGWTWCVFSPTLWEMFDVTQVWVDDAFDTQRRRGPDAVGRTLVTL